MSTAVKGHGATTTPRTSTPPRVAVAIPPQADGARSSWRRLIHQVDPTKRGSWAFEGPWLDADTAYEMPEGAVVLVVDRFARRWEIRMTTAQLGGLEDVHAWTVKSPLGKRVVDYVARRLPAGSQRASAVRLEALPNRWAGWCRRCRGEVRARAGRVETLGGRTVVVHHPGQCPPPPEVVNPNRYPGLCFACGGWVAGRTGVAVRRETPRETGAMYDPMHNQCPADPVPGPPNKSAGWCTDCGEIAAPGEGHWRDRRLHHTGACPPSSTAEPTWIYRLTRGRRVAAGEVVLARLTLRDDDHPIPHDTPGYRVLDESFVEVAVVVVETVTSASGTVRARVRAACAAEAADLLAARMHLLPDVHPHPAGFKARFEAERIGDNHPWLAELTGRTAGYGGFQRRFLRADRDYTHANSRGTRGVVYAWTLTINRVYEACWWTSWKNREREFLRATPEGDVVEISREEAEAWLDHAPEWH